jgi:hypothetical protein
VSEAVEVLQQLLRFNTVNPPGNERPAQEYLAAHLTEAGLEVTLAGEDPERPNLVARLRGCAAARRARPSACSATSTPSWPTRPSGATARGRARWTRAASGAAVRST